MATRDVSPTACQYGIGGARFDVTYLVTLRLSRCIGDIGASSLPRHHEHKYGAFGVYKGAMVICRSIRYSLSLMWIAGNVTACESREACALQSNTKTSYYTPWTLNIPVPQSS